MTNAFPRPTPAMPLVVHVINSLAVGGLENGVVNLVNTTTSRFRHVIVCMTADGPLHGRLRPEVEVIVLGKRPGQDPWPCSARAASPPPAAAHRPLAQLARWTPFPPRASPGYPWSSTGSTAGKWRIRMAAIGAVIASSCASPLVHQFVTVSTDLRRWLTEDVGVPAGKVTAIHNGVDFSRFGRAGRLESRVRLSLPGEAPIVGTVGRLDPVKDQAGLIRAFSRVRAQHPEALLVVAGDGPCRGELERAAIELGQRDHVRLLGNRDDIPAVMAALDVFVLPSIAEGISNTSWKPWRAACRSSPPASAAIRSSSRTGWTARWFRAPIRTPSPPRSRLRRRRGSPPPSRAGFPPAGHRPLQPGADGSGVHEPLLGPGGHPSGEERLTMCGISGVVYRDPAHPVDRELLQRVTTVISHRGPDADGFFCGAGRGPGPPPPEHHRSGHRRPADLQRGPQPSGSSSTARSTTSRSCAPTSLRRGHRFATAATPRPLSTPTRSTATSASPRCAGMFAIALWDGREQPAPAGARSHRQEAALLLRDGRAPRCSAPSSRR